MPSRPSGGRARRVTTGGNDEEAPIPADRILDAATRIADLLLDVQTRVNGQIDAALTDLLPDVRQRLVSHRRTPSTCPAW